MLTKAYSAVLLEKWQVFIHYENIPLGEILGERIPIPPHDMDEKPCGLIIINRVHFSSVLLNIYGYICSKEKKLSPSHNTEKSISPG